ncbi:hypothetical protein SAE02_11690 [Skermanella aerolata]|uniref:Uncharacterized protein n=1 Tax=Skermanella aerolata TaxID=393310 RepID=A0A512DKL6_9PROT|nr:hypothetical protein SAE02_11690 [Skermanella aerolata]
MEYGFYTFAIMATWSAVDGKIIQRLLPRDRLQARILPSFEDPLYSLGKPVPRGSINANAKAFCTLSPHLDSLDRLTACQKVETAC